MFNSTVSFIGASFTPTRATVVVPSRTRYSFYPYIKVRKVAGYTLPYLAYGTGRGQGNTPATLAANLHTYVHPVTPFAQWL